MEHPNSLKSAQPQQPSRPVVSRPNFVLWWNVIVLGGMLGGFLYPWISSRTFPSPGYLAIFALPCGGLGVLIFNLSWTRIAADEDGLSWRSWLHPGERRIRWSQVRDYYNTESGYRHPIVETEFGRVSLKKQYSNHERLMAYIAARALNARNRGWWLQSSALGVGETRIFRYGRGARATFPVAFIVLTLFFGVCFYGISVTTPKGAPPGTKSSLGDKIEMSLIVGGCASFFYGLGLWPMYKTFRWLPSHLTDEISINELRVRWTDGERIVESEWDRVLELKKSSEWASYAYTLESKDGSFDMDFTVLRNGRQLKDIILRHLPNSPETKVRS